jgi:hypothetical protein
MDEIADSGSSGGNRAGVGSIEKSNLRRLDRLFALSLFLSFLLYFGLGVFKVVWFGDICRYLAAVSALQTSFWSPGHEAVAAVSSQDSVIFTPFIVGAAILGKALSLSPFGSLQFTGILNLGLYVLAICHFFRVFSVSRRCWTAPALFLLVSLTVRRFNYGWSSETSLMTFRWVQAYPSTFGWSVVLLTLAETELYLRSGRYRHLFSIAIGVWVLFISHVLSAGWLLGLIFLRISFHLVHPEKESQGNPWLLAGVVAVSLLTTRFWPYFDVLRFFTLTGQAEDPPFGRNIFSEVWYPFLLGIPALVFFAIRGQHRLLLLWFAGTWGAFLLCKLLGIGFGARYIFFQQFFLHVAIAEIMTLGLRKWLSKDERASRPLLVLFGVSCLGVILSPQIYGAFYAPDRLRSPKELLALPSNRELLESKWSAYRRSLGPGDIVLTPLDESPAYLSAYTGCRSIVGVHTTLLRDTEERRTAVAEFFDANLPWEQRLRGLTAYDVTKVLVPRDRADEIEKIVGPPLQAETDYAVYSAAQMKNRKPQE